MLTVSSHAASQLLQLATDLSMDERRPAQLDASLHQALVELLIELLAIQVLANEHHLAYPLLAFLPGLLGLAAELHVHRVEHKLLGHTLHGQNALRAVHPWAVLLHQPPDEDVQLVLGDLAIPLNANGSHAVVMHVSLLLVRGVVAALVMAVTVVTTMAAMGLAMALSVTAMATAVRGVCAALVVAITVASTMTAVALLMGIPMTTMAVAVLIRFEEALVDLLKHLVE
mmetsp:Transcript_10131/g.30019  ORF Transcript_10131/g.30019 Transcript_10131/m.30019 type:complete len:228 (-) Transcript_10131:1129-1812(-)